MLSSVTPSRPNPLPFCHMANCQPRCMAAQTTLLPRPDIKDHSKGAGRCRPVSCPVFEKKNETAAGPALHVHLAPHGKPCMPNFTPSSPYTFHTPLQFIVHTAVLRTIHAHFLILLTPQDFLHAASSPALTPPHHPIPTDSRLVLLFVMPNQGNRETS